MRALSVICVMLLITYSIQQSKEADLVKDLNGDGSNYTVAYDKDWYSGYLDINLFGTFEHNYQMHYWFFPSQSDNAATDPLVLWLNGGPGCSSLLGALTEHGPFMYVGDSDNNTKNEYSWNNNANILPHMFYLESPPGVGFSLSDDYSFSDQLTAQTNLAAIRAFLQRFPEYKNNKFYITGESYGGIYVPTLAYLIQQYNEDADEKINLKGIMVGNGAVDPKEVPNLCVNPDVDNELLMPFVNTYLHQQGVIPDEIWTQYSLSCTHLSEQTKQQCKDSLKNISDLLHGFNTYNIDGFCYPPHNQNANKKSANLKLTPPCINAQGSMRLLNNHDVQKKLHIDPPMRYEMCSEQVGENYRSSPLASIYVMPFLISRGIKIWIYSGDADAAVPITGTFKWIKDLRKQYGYNDLIPYTPWYQQVDGISGKQQGGSFWMMDGLTFVRFKGCGHMVPGDNPQGAYQMFDAYINDKIMDLDP